MSESFLSLLLDKRVISIAIVLCLSLIASIVIHQIRKKSEFLSETQRRWISRTKNWTIILSIVSLLVIWAPELKHFALSIAAVAVAFVIATKELILNLSGALLRASTQSFNVGDWIEVGEHRGEVIDVNPLTTTIQEIESAKNRYSYTGRTVSIPNGMFLSTPVSNMNFMKRYVYHRFDIYTEPGTNIFQAKALILNNAQRYCEHFVDVARRYNSFIEKRAGIDLPEPEPKVRVSTTELGKNVFSVTLFCPTPEAVNIEQNITRDFFDFFHTLQQSLPPTTEKTERVTDPS